MQELLSYFQGINSFHWGSNWYQWLFYASIVLIIIFERNKLAKSVFGFFPALFLLLIFNPLFNNVIHYVFLNVNAYYARMYSFMPLMFCIAFGLMQLVKHSRKEWMKLILLCMVSALIIIGGDNFYHAPWMTKASNIEKIPKGATEVVDILQKEKHIINVAACDPLNVYIRQIDAAIITPYGRYMNELGMELSQSVPDVSYVMSEAGKQAVDYIVVQNNPECKEHFEDEGYRPYAETEGYLIYEVIRVPHIKREYNNKRQIIAVTNYDEMNNPIENSQGYSTIEYEYDENGLIAKQSFLDRNGNKVLLYGKYASFLKVNKPISKLVESLIYLDENDEPVLVLGRYETRYSYEKNGRLFQESYYDQNGQKMNRTDTYYASKRISYDNQGRVIGEQYYNTEGSLTNSFFGYASFTREYDQNNKVIRENYYGIDGLPVYISSGYASVARTFTEDGKKLREMYFDENGDPQKCRAGYFCVEYSYDSDKVREKYYNENRNPTVLPCGYAAYEREQNEKEGLVSETYYGAYDEVLGKVDLYGSTTNQLFRFSHCSEGTYISCEGNIEMESIAPGNLFDSVYFILNNATTNEYVSHFGKGNAAMTLEGEYVHNSPSGIYIIRLKANGYVSDDWIECTQYINKGDIIHYSYNIDKLDKECVRISNLRISIQQ